MILLWELIWWMLDHWRDLTISGVLIFIGRKMVIKEVKQLLHLDDGRDKIEWTLEQVEALSGKKYPGPTHPSWQQAQKQLRPLYKRLRAATDPARTRVRGDYTKLNGGKSMKNVNYVTLVAAVLGSFKIIIQALFGIDIPDDTINSIVNGVAAVVTLVGVIMTHRKPDTLQVKSTNTFDGTKTS